MSLPEKSRAVHFVGIGGYGMSALALVLLEKGYRVSGSDLKESSLTAGLKTRGATVFTGHRAENVGEAEVVIYSTAVPPGNAEILEAKKRGLSLWHRSELLAALLNSAYGIAIAGAHGKTTTTAMTALLLEEGGYDPTAIVGGVVPRYGGNARVGSSRYLVAEADESDSSFLRYYPQLALVTGMEADHLEHYDHDYARLARAYRTFLSHVPTSGTAILCADDAGLCELGRELTCRVVYYGTGRKTGINWNTENAKNIDGLQAPHSIQSTQISQSAQVTQGMQGMPGTKSSQGSLGSQGSLDSQDSLGSESYLGTLGSHSSQSSQGVQSSQSAQSSKVKPYYHADRISLQGRSASFDFCRDGKLLASGITLGAPGLHNVANAVGALAATTELGGDPARCAGALAGFSGAGRRFEEIGVVDGVTVIDDYAHHPTEVRATLEAAQGAGRSVICLFQPHRYTRTAAFFEQFAAAFDRARLVLLHSVYSAGEEPIEGADGEALAARMRRVGQAQAGQTEVYYHDDLSVLEEKAVAAAKPGDLIITMGAGDVTLAAPRIVERLERKKAGGE